MTLPSASLKKIVGEDAVVECDNCGRILYAPEGRMIDTLRLAQGQRLIAISDVHGHIQLLHALLDQVRYCEDDALVFLGDYIERGAHSLPVLEFVARAFCGQAAKCAPAAGQLGAIHSFCH